MASDIPSQHPILAALASKLDEMTLHDETGHPHDEGYMTAVRETRDWLGERSAALKDGMSGPADQ